MALVADVLREIYDIEDIPNSGDSRDLRRRAEVAYELLHSRCEPVSRMNIRPGDIVLVSVFGHAAHIGIMATRDSVLHLPTDNMGPVVEPLTSPWLSNRIVGFYRPAELAK